MVRQSNESLGLANSIAIEKAAGKTETTLVFERSSVDYSVLSKAQQMLAALELYALDCYRKTEEHKQPSMR